MTPDPDSPQRSAEGIDLDDDIALLALGALPDEERARVEARVASSEELAEKLRGYELLVGELAEAVAARPTEETEASAALRERVLAAVCGEPRADVIACDPAGSRREDASIQVWKSWKGSPGREVEPGLHIVRAGDGDWETTAVEGVRVRRLRTDPRGRSVTMLVRMDPGVTYPAHVHHGVEECLVLEGDVRVGDHVMRAGDYQVASSESTHLPQSTSGGCLLFIVSSMDDELI